MTADEMLDALMDDSLTTDGFDHAAHLRVAHAALRRFEFFEAAHVYASGLRRFAARLGVPEKYHATVTLAFLCLVAERMGDETSDSFPDLHPDLFADPLARAGYGPARLGNPRARRIGLLPLA